MKRAAVGILVASLFTATAAMAGQGYAGGQRPDSDSRNDHSDRRDDRNDRNDRGRDERRHDDRDHRDHRDYRSHDRVVVRHVAPPVRYLPVRYGVYHTPRGFYEHSWRRGERLPVAYYQRPYVIADYNAYRLYSPPRGYHWVRVNHDAVLAGIATGVVFGIVNNLFH